MNSKNNVIIEVERDKDSTKFVGPPHILRKIIFLVADHIWPDWYENEKGREIHFRYADNAARQGYGVFANKNYLDDRLWPTVRSQMQLFGIQFHTRISELVEHRDHHFGSDCQPGQDQSGS